MNYKIKKRVYTIPEGILKAEMIALAVTIILSGVMAWLVIRGKLEEGKIGYGVMLILFTAPFLGSLYAVKNIKRRILFLSSFTGIIYWVSLLLITMALFGGDLSMAGEKGGIILIGSSAASLLCAHTKKH